jgi:hypothetical protein
MYNTAEMLVYPCIAPLRFFIFDALDYFTLPSHLNISLRLQRLYFAMVHTSDNFEMTLGRKLLR